MFEGNFCGMKNLSFDIHTCDDRFAGEQIWGFGFRVSCSGFHVPGFMFRIIVFITHIGSATLSGTPNSKEN